MRTFEVDYLKRFFDGLQRDARLFFFILMLIEVYRLVFILIMSAYMAPESTSAEVWKALWTGLRLSLKTAGAVTLLSLVFATMIGLGNKCRLAIGVLASFVLSILFQARFPYYQAFQSTYGFEVVHGMQEDFGTMISMFLDGYGLFWRLLVAIVLTAVCLGLLWRLINLRTVKLPALKTKPQKVGFTVGLICSIMLFGLFARFGGSLTYASGVNWENAGVTSDYFLNECILDDVQALYRARAMGKRMEAGDISGVEQDKILEYAKEIAGNEKLESNDLKDYLTRKAGGSMIEKPQHIFIILGETWMQWPMLGKYEDLHVADGIKSLIAQDNCYYSRNFLPNGNYTSVAITGMVTGLSEVNIKVNYQPRTFEEVYITSMAEPFKRLGYQVDFWYGGVPSWDNINKLALSQGFDNFYGYPDFHGQKQNTWGTTDKNLFNALEDHLAEEPPTVHLIMTTTNHPPYNLNLTAEGFDTTKKREELSKYPNVYDANTLAIELGHYWYMDMVASQFVKNVSEKYPSSVFVITGDHAVRTDPSTHPTLFEHQSVPFVLYGQGIDKKILPQDAPGGHTSIVPTLIEMIAPKDFEYVSIAPPMGLKNGAGFNRDVYIANSTIGKVDSDTVELLPHLASKELNKINLSEERENSKRVVSMMRTLSWWLLTNGKEIPNPAYTPPPPEAASTDSTSTDQKKS